MNPDPNNNLKSFQKILSDLIERLYSKSSQDTTRTILKAYFLQSPDRRRRMTLDSLGKAKGLKKKVTRERARQILDKFLNKDIPKEIIRLERGIEYGDEVTLSRRKDLATLSDIVASIVIEVETFSLPIFADRIQPRIKRLGLVVDQIYFPVIVDLAHALSIEMKFQIINFDGNRIILEKNCNVKEFTSDLITHAGKVSTHMGGVFPFSYLIDSKWNDQYPKCLESLDPEIGKKYLIDLFKTKGDLLLLQDETFYAFKGRDERLSSILLPIFTIYKNQIEKEILFDAVLTGIRHRFMGKTKTPEREIELEILAASPAALDEYCLRTLLLDSRPDGYRVPGKNLVKALKTYKPGEIHEAQFQIVKKLREYGRPLSSAEFGEVYRNELNLRKSFRVSLYSFPTLYYKKGAGRMNDFYSTLDNQYESSKKVTVCNRRATSRNLDAIKSQIKQLQDNLHMIENGNLYIGQLRKEQGLLRKFLLADSDGVETTAGDKSGKCLICNRYLPQELLLAAHVKKRSSCSDEEKADIENIAMLQCGSCDKLFENGFIYIDKRGVIKTNENATMTGDLVNELVKVEGNECEYFNTSRRRQKYIRFHRNFANRKFLDQSD